jgi:hypothetical protein
MEYTTQSCRNLVPHSSKGRLTLAALSRAAGADIGKYYIP